MTRRIQVNRVTKETSIELMVNLDGRGNSIIKTPIGFFNHMLNLLAFHSGLDIEIIAKGDDDVCDHHLIEDCGILLGQAIKTALGEKKGIRRYATIFLPMDETLIMSSLDISGRAFLHFEGEFKRDSIGEFSTEMVQEFFRALSFNSGMTLHLRILYGENDHHKIEALFKGFARALKEAIIVDGNQVTSSKGVLE